MEDRKKDNSNGIDRRAYLIGGASFIAAPFLSSCGGGAEDAPNSAAVEGPQMLNRANDEATQLQDEFSSDQTSFNELSPSEQPIQKTVANNTPIKYLSRSSREVFYLEVAHRGARASTVKLYAGLGTAAPATILSRRSANTGSMYSLQFATLDTTPLNVADTITNRMLLQQYLWCSVEISDSSGLRTGIFGATKSNGTANVSKYFYSDINETEWLVAYSGVASPTNWDVALRLIIAEPEEMGPRRGTWVTEVSSAEPAFIHNGNKTIDNSSVDPTQTADSASFSAGFIAHTRLDGGGSLVLPNHRHLGAYELVKPLGHTFSSTHARDHSARRVWRHLSRFYVYLQNTYSNAGAVGARFAAELNKCILGAQIYKSATTSRRTAMLSIKALPEPTMSQYFQTCLQSLYKYASQGNRDRLIPTLDPAPFKDLFQRASRSGTLSTQVRVAGDFSGFGLSLAAGVKFSITELIDAYTTTNIPIAPSVSYLYSITDVPRFVKSTITILVQPAAGFTFGALSHTPAIEVNMNLTTDNAMSTRIDSVVLDIVYDFVAGGIVANLVGKISKLISNLGICPDLSSLLANNFPSCCSSLTYNYDTLPDINSIYNPGNSIPGGSMLPDSSIAARVNSFMAQLRWYVATGVVQAKQYSTLELSIFRTGIYNTDILGDIFRRGWQGNSSIAYTPGIKFIFGVGLAWGEASIRQLYTVQGFAVKGAPGLEIALTKINN